MSSPLVPGGRSQGDRPSDLNLGDLGLDSQRAMTTAEYHGQPSDMDSDEGTNPPQWDNDGDDG